MGANVQKNLIYYIYYNGIINHYHILNLQYLRKYWSVFDGQIVVKIAVDSDYDLSYLIDLMPGYQFEVVKNDPKTGEGAHFIDSINQVSDGMTFYAHCKGVSRPLMDGLDTWVKHLYESNLGSIPVLGEKLFSGTCAKILPCAPYVPQDFHYSGSFYWFNTNEVKKRIGLIEPDKYLTERFPAMIAKKDECFFNWPYSDKNVNFYLNETWKRL